MKFYLFDYYLSNLVICIAPIFHGWLLFCLNFKKARRQVQKRSTPKLKALRDSKNILERNLLLIQRMLIYLLMLTPMFKKV